ncbi:hypothetical protein RNJ44_00917 [Nakaseomyces bracarensis]|uniref:SPRY domain-containing protein n=1 Tax=Nakaseomyces bracarensis TaxID=273131 RepID=A0ABR4NQI6_9SACH
MRPEFIPYQPETDLVYLDSKKRSEERRPKLPAYQETHQLDDVSYVKTEDIPLNRRNFVYRPCLPNPLFTELGYCTTEYPFDVSGVSIQDRSDGISLVSGANHTVGVTQSNGWRTARSDVCIKEGSAYWEVEVVNNGECEESLETSSVQQRRQFMNSSAHIRLGITRREASLEGPVGFDSYGYGVRDFSLESIHDGKLQQVLSKAPMLKKGDRLGFLVKLPSMEEQIKQAEEYTNRRLEAMISHGNVRKESSVDHDSYYTETQRKKQKRATTNADFQRALLEDIDHTNVIRDHIPIRYKNQLFYEATDYVKTTKPEYYSSDKRERQDYYTLADSYMAVYLNGEYLGKAFEDLKPFLPPFSELQYNEKFYYGYWKHGTATTAIASDTASTAQSADSTTNVGSDTLTQAQRGTAQGLILRNKYVNNNKLGYYPTLSCFKGGTAKIITNREDLHYLTSVDGHPGDSTSTSIGTGTGTGTASDRNIYVLDELYRAQIAEDLVWDIIDEVEEESKSLLLV